MAEAIFRELVRGREDYQVASAGVGAYNGEEPSRYTVEVLQDRGMDLSCFRSRPLTGELVESATHIFGMTFGHLRTLEMMFPGAADKLYLVTEFTPDDAIRGHDLPDPYGGPRDGYEFTSDVLHQVLPSLVAYIDQTFERTPQESAPS
jgi:protein-tyrosine-phosphatase